MKKTLLEKALEKSKYHVFDKYSKQEIELVIAVLRGKISYRQASDVLNVNHSKIISMCNSAIRYALNEGIIDIVWKK